MEKLPLDIEELEKRIGYTFKNKSLITTALTHSSYSNELKAKHKVSECNERLEFLGDSVLSIIVSEYLFINYKDKAEGDLTRMRANSVCERALAEYAEKIQLGKFLLLGIGEEKGNGRQRKSILADAFEAVLAAIYLDAGGDLDMGAGKRSVEKFLMPFIVDEVNRESSAVDYKTMLQQFIQQSGTDVLEYIVVSESGPDHRKTFEVEAMMNSNIIGRGEGHTKREAEQNSAKQALELFGELKKQ